MSDNILGPEVNNIEKGGKQQQKKKKGKRGGRYSTASLHPFLYYAPNCELSSKSESNSCADLCIFLGFSLDLQPIFQHQSSTSAMMLWIAIFPWSIMKDKNERMLKTSAAASWAIQRGGGVYLLRLCPFLSFFFFSFRLSVHSRARKSSPSFSSLFFFSFFLLFDHIIYSRFFVIALRAVVGPRLVDWANNQVGENSWTDDWIVRKKNDDTNEKRIEFQTNRTNTIR